MHHHKANATLSSAPQAMFGQCQCPGCNNAFSHIIERCTCGAERTVCSGMGAASLQRHVAHGFSRWQPMGSTRDEEDR